MKSLDDLILNDINLSSNTAEVKQEKVENDTEMMKSDLVKIKLRRFIVARLERRQARSSFKICKIID